MKKKILILLPVKGEYKFEGVQMTSYIETAKDSISLGETVNIATETKQSGLGPVGIKRRARRHKEPVGVKDKQTKARRHKLKGPVALN